MERQVRPLHAVDNGAVPLGWRLLELARDVVAARHGDIRRHRGGHADWGGNVPDWLLLGLVAGVVVGVVGREGVCAVKMEAAFAG